MAAGRPQPTTAFLTTWCLMTRTALLLVRLVLLAVSLCAGALQPTRLNTAAPAYVSPDAAASALPEVRIRKLHLVRPDLIHYPLMIEVVC